MNLWEQYLIESEKFDYLQEGKLDFVIRAIERVQKVKVWIMEQIAALIKKLGILEQAKKARKFIGKEAAALEKEMARVQGKIDKLKVANSKKTKELEELIKVKNQLKKDLKNYVGNAGKLAAGKKTAKTGTKVKKIKANKKMNLGGAPKKKAVPKKKKR